MIEPQPVIPSAMNPPLNPVLVTDEKGLELVADFLRRTFIFGLDIETNVTNTFVDRRIRTIQLGDRNEQYVIDLLPFAQRAGVSLEAAQAADGTVRVHPCLLPVVETLRSALESDVWTKVGTNLEFEYTQFKWCFGFRIRGLYDVLIADKLIHAGTVHFMATGFWALEDMVRRYCGLVLSSETPDENKDASDYISIHTGRSFDLVSPLKSAQIEYCALDVRLPMAIKTGQAKQIVEGGLQGILQIENDAIGAFADMHINGLLIDTAAWQVIIDDYTSKLYRIVNRLDEFFLPKIGAKFVSERDRQTQAELEAAWRQYPNKTVEEKQGRAAARKSFMEFRKDVNARLKKADKCEGNAAVQYASPADLKKCLIRLGFKNIPDTNDETLESLASDPKLDVESAFGEKGDPTLQKYTVIDCIRLFRSVTKVLTTYGSAWITTLDEGGYIHPTTGRIHSRINQIGAATGRTSSTNPNVQNLPRGSAFRYCFVARPGYKILTVDMSGAELRILAEMSGEPVWVEAFGKGWDVHSVCAEIIFGDEWRSGADANCVFAEKKQKCKCKAHKKLREIAKTLNFGLAYGMGPRKLSRGVGISYEEAVEVFEKFKRSFPVVFEFLEQLGRIASQTLQATDLTGRRRKWNRPTWEKAYEKAKSELKDKARNPTNEQVRKVLKGMFHSIEREGKNMPIQSANASFIKLAMGEKYLAPVLESKYGSFLVNCVHDELVVECPEECAEEVLALVRKAMTDASGEYMKKIVMETEGNIDTKWSK